MRQQVFFVVLVSTFFIQVFSYSMLITPKFTYNKARSFTDARGSGLTNVNESLGNGYGFGADFYISFNNFVEATYGLHYQKFAGTFKGSDVTNLSLQVKSEFEYSYLSIPLGIRLRSNPVVSMPFNFLILFNLDSKLKVSAYNHSNKIFEVKSKDEEVKDFALGAELGVNLNVFDFVFETKFFYILSEITEKSELFGGRVQIGYQF